MHAVVVAGEYVSAVVGPGVVVLDHSPAGPPLVPLRGRQVHCGLGLLLGSFVAGMYLPVLHLQASKPLGKILLEGLVD